MATPLGVFDHDLFSRYKAEPEGPLKRRLHDQLVRQNTPLVRVLVSQMVGTSAPAKRKSAAANMGGKGDFEKIEPDDAMQLGLIALARALQTFDPSKGKIAYFTAQWLRHEMQKFCTFQMFLARAPSGKANLRPRVGLVGLPTEGEERVSQEEHAFFAGEARLEDILASDTPQGGDKLTRSAVDGWQDVLDDEGLAENPEFRRAAEAFQETGVWPAELASLEALQTKMAAGRLERLVTPEPAPKIIYSIPTPVVILTPFERFVLKRCVVTSSGRADEFDVWNRYRIDCRHADEPEGSRVQFVSALQARWPVRQTTKREGGKHIRALAGLRVRRAGETAVYR
jgi:hypothetical protein